MTERKLNSTTHTCVLIPLLGNILFILTYIIAASLYPGGSQAALSSKGFSWLHNYWCNLLNEKAINGEYNIARPVAITGLFVLCISLAIFWYQFAQLVKFGKTSRKIIQFSGIMSMCATLFLFTSYHNIIINIASLFAIFALAGTLAGLYRTAWLKLFWIGIFNLALAGINNFIYYTNELIYYLPVVQKITFLSFLVWIGLINIGLLDINTKENN